MQGAHGVGVGVDAEDLRSGGELLARLREATRFVQGPPGGGLGPSDGPGVAPLQMILAGAAGQLDRRGVVSGGVGGFGGAYPQRARIQLTVAVWSVHSTGGEFGSGGVAGGGPGRGAGPLGAFGGADQGGDGLAADVVGIGIAGDGVQGVQVVPGDDIGDFLAVAGEGLPQVRGDLEVAGFPVTARECVVGDLAEHVLGELVAAPLRGQRVSRHRQHLAAYQVGQGHTHGRLVSSGDRDQRLGREGDAEHRGFGYQPPHVRVQHVQAGSQQRVQAVRDGQLPDVADQPVHALDRLDDVPVDQGPHRLHREQRHALGLAGDFARAAAGIPGTSASTS